MTKEQIGKEIKELIRSIKTHYTFVEEEDRIPLIELELITSKIRKLYEKSVINNYLHSTDETYMSKERSRRFHERRNFEKNPAETFVKKTVVETPPVIAPSFTAPAEQPIAVENTVPPSVIVQTAPEVKKVDSLATAVNTTSGKALKDLKMLIGINDKFLLINNLFARNDVDYKNAIEHLSSLRTLEESQNYMNGQSRQYSWNNESYAYVRLQQILEKRYK